jgi:hypothetical protein
MVGAVVLICRGYDMDALNLDGAIESDIEPLLLSQIQGFVVGRPPSTQYVFTTQRTTQGFPLFILKHPRRHLFPTWAKTDNWQFDNFHYLLNKIKHYITQFL